MDSLKTATWAINSKSIELANKLEEASSEKSFQNQKKQKRDRSATSPTPTLRQTSTVWIKGQSK